jgi:hypothetical protein
VSQPQTHLEGKVAFGNVGFGKGLSSLEKREPVGPNEGEEPERQRAVFSFVPLSRPRRTEPYLSFSTSNMRQCSFLPCSRFDGDWLTPATTWFD